METVSDSFTLGNSGGFLDISELVYVGGVDSNAITLPELAKYLGRKVARVKETTPSADAVG